MPLAYEVPLIVADFIIPLVIKPRCHLDAVLIAIVVAIGSPSTYTP